MIKLTKKWWISSLVMLTVIACSPANVETTTPESREAENSEVTLIAAPDNWRQNTHIHSIGINPDNPEVIYLATHHGLIKRSEAGEWLQVGENRSDFMSFAIDPQDSSRFYGSGHPPTGGNLGFVVSDNQGQDWQLQALSGVDFHALAIAPADPNIIYGWITSGKQGEEGFFVSKDGGKNWTQLITAGLEVHPFSLAVDPSNKNHLFATTELGLYESKDGGSNWKAVANSLQAPIASLALVEESNQTIIYAYPLQKETSGIFRSKDYGKTWEPVGQGIEGLILQLAVAPSNPQILYAVNQESIIFQSRDSGKTWQELK
ncbi:MAG: hypothetical protein WA919_21085 [Coleofasciculaceae cyanobacterium]